MMPLYMKMSENINEMTRHLKFYYISIYITYMIFTTAGFFEVAIESWSEWDLNQ